MFVKIIAKIKMRMFQFTAIKFLDMCVNGLKWVLLCIFAAKLQRIELGTRRNNVESYYVYKVKYIACK